MRLIDLTKVNFSSDDNDDYITVGGRIISMEWDPTGKYLAILFQVKIYEFNYSLYVTVFFHTFCL